MPTFPQMIRCSGPVAAILVLANVGNAAGAPADDFRRPALSHEGRAEFLTINGNRFALETANGQRNLDAVAPYAFSVDSGDRDIQRFEVRAGDHSWIDKDPANPRNRSELDGWFQHYPLGAPIWVSYSFSLEGSGGGRIPHSTQQYCIIGQMHGADTRVPPFAVNLAPGDVLTIEAGGERVHGRIYSAMKPLTRGVVYHIVSRQTYHTDGTGLVQVWLDGKLIVTYSGDLGYAADKQGPYWKYGIYRHEAPNTLVVEFSNMEVGTQDLSGRIGNPKQWGGEHSSSTSP